MNKQLFVFILVAMAVFTIPVFADSTQQYNKIFLNPFYVNSIGAGSSVIYTAVLNPPDHVSSVVSAIIGFNAQINGQTQNFTLRVNGQACNPSSYAVATAFSTTGNVQFYFDCTGVIKSSGTYQLNLTSSVATGAVSGWIDFTYMNSPTGQVKYVGGTDYWSGETATVFLQLQDASGAAVDNASCNFDMYNTTNPLLTPIYNKQPMVFRGADGIYYYQFSTVGLPEGVYPLDAECVYNYDNVYFYSGISPLINVTTNSGTFQGGSSVTLNAYDDALNMEWSSTPNVTFTWTNITNKSNITSLNLYWMGEITAVRTITFYAYNATANGYSVNLGTLTTTAGGGSVTPTGNSDLFTARVPLSLVNGTNLSVQMVVSGAGTLWVNWLTLNAYRNSSYVTEVKGSSEVHIYPSNIALNTTVSVNLSSIQGILSEINLTTHQNQLYLISINGTVNGISSNVGTILNLAQSINVTGNNNLAFLSAINGTANSILTIVTDTNTTVYYNKNLLTAMNITLAQNNAYLKSINATVTVNTQTLSQVLGYSQDINATVYMNKATLNTILGFSQEINRTTHAINFTPTIILTPVFNVTVQNITNTYNYSYLTVNNFTNIYNYSYLTVNNFTNVYNYSYLTENNFTVIYNNSYLTENNFTIVYNNTFNATYNYSYLTENNFTVVYNYTQNITFAPVFNVTVQNVTNVFNYSYLTENNFSFVYNYSYLTENNFTNIYNYSYLTENNFTVIYNYSYLTENNLTIVYNTTYNNTYNYSYLTENNFTIVYNYTQNVSVVLNPLFNITITNLSEVLSGITEINDTLTMNTDTLAHILGNSTLSNSKLDDLKINVLHINTTANQLEIKLDYINSTLNNVQSTVNNIDSKTTNIYADTQQILVMLNNLTVGNITINANVNVSQIVEAILGADVTQTTVSSSGTPQYAGDSLLGGVAFAAPLDNGVSSRCLSNETLQTSYTTLRCVNSVCNTIETNTTLTCQFGCNMKVVPNTCFASPQQNSNYWIIVILLIIVVLIYAIMRYSRR